MKSFNLTEWALEPPRHRAVPDPRDRASAACWASRKLGQLEDPNFSVPSMTAMVIWPGATAQQIQDEVLNRMEKKFEQLDHFEKVVTYRAPGLRRHDASPSTAAPRRRTSARRGTRRARSSATSSSSCPKASSARSSTTNTATCTGLLYAVKGDGIGHAELSDMAEDIKRRLLKVPMVKKVDIYGKQAKKVYVEFSHERLAALGITPLQIAESLRNQNSVLAERLDRHAAATACSCA